MTKSESLRIAVCAEAIIGVVVRLLISYDLQTVIHFEMFIKVLTQNLNEHLDLSKLLTVVS